jgi:hypothetical protein
MFDASCGSAWFVLMFSSQQEQVQETMMWSSD